MADYAFQYKMNTAPRTQNDGSGTVIIYITAVARDLAVTPIEWFDVPGRSKDFVVPAEDLQPVLDGPVAQAINNLKTALATNIDTIPVPIWGWDQASLEAYMDANDTANTVRDELDALITTYKTYPLVFS